jgi:BirA family biotin operon repressor/biotin-[acetyl-CoA-carboxylase] ligase
MTASGGLAAVSSDAIRHISLDVTDSTNTRAVALAREGEAGPLWITAKDQTAGRGRRGNRWASGAGNLFASLLLTDPSAGPRVAELSFVTALAVHDAILACALALAPAPTLKWPNDVLVGGAKIAGILIEGEGSRVIIGVGINCAHHPHDTPYPATDLAAQGACVTPEAAFVALRRAMAARLSQWDRGAGFEAIRADWLACASGVGSPIRVRLPGREIDGVFESLDEKGRLVLRRADGVCETIMAGDVFPLATAPSAAELEKHT